MHLKKTILMMILANLILPPMTGAEEIVKAQVGVEIIQMGKGADNIRKARAINKLTEDEMLKVLVNPEEDSFVYIINSNEREAALLNRSSEEQFIKKGQKTVFPNVGQLYKPNSVKNTESLTIVVSPDENTDIKQLFASGTTSNDQWQILEEGLVQASSLLSEDQPQNRMKMGGTVRGLEPPAIEHRTAAGKGMIIKKYKFHVEK